MKMGIIFWAFSACGVYQLQQLGHHHMACYAAGVTCLVALFWYFATLGYKTDATYWLVGIPANEDLRVFQTPAISAFAVFGVQTAIIVGAMRLGYENWLTTSLGAFMAGVGVSLGLLILGFIIVLLIYYWIDSSKEAAEEERRRQRLREIEHTWC